MTCCPLGSLLIRDWMTWNTGLGSEASASSTLQNKAKQVKSHLTVHHKNAKWSQAASLSNTWWRFMLCISPSSVLMCSSYWGCGCESPLRRFMTSVPRIMARLVRPTPTWQLKSRAGSRRDASWPRDKLTLSWKTEHTWTRDSQETADCKTPNRDEWC